MLDRQSNYDISVIMGMYNCEDTIVEAIDSLLMQSFQNFEVILCDDGSIDNTLNVVKNHIRGYGIKFKLLINEKNLGLNKTLNRCLEVASGKYIARMDADDISISDRFEKQLNYLNENPMVSFVSSSMIYFNDTGDYARSYPDWSPQNKSFMTDTSPFAHAPAMIRVQAYHEVGGYTESRRLLRVEDYNLWMKMYAKGLKGVNMEEPLYKMRNDINAINRRTFRSRINESYSMRLAVQELKLPFWNYLYTLIPLFKALMPTKLYTYLHRRKFTAN